MNQPSPYTSPESKPLPEINKPIFKKNSYRQGAVWFNRSVKRTFNGAGIWGLFGFLNAIAIIVFTFIPFAMTVLYPVVIAGAMNMAKDQDNNVFNLASFNEVFRKNTGQLFLSGALYTAGTFALFFVSFIVFLVLILILVSLESNIDVSSLLSGSGFTLLVTLFSLILIGLSLPLMMLFWFSPALILLKNIDAIPASKISFKACMKNMLPYLSYSLVALAYLLLLFGGLAAIYYFEDESKVAFYTLSVILSIFSVLYFPALFFNGIYESFLDIFDTENIENENNEIP